MCIFNLFSKVSSTSNSSAPPPPPPPLPHHSKPRRALKKLHEEFCAETDAKRIRIENEPKRGFLGETKHVVEAKANDESVAITVEEIEETNVGSDARLTICLKCGFNGSGTHANVSYCLSEHMCESKPKKHRYLNVICIIANAMYANGMCFDSDSKEATSTPNSSMNQPSPSDDASEHNVSAIASSFSESNQPFNPSNIGRALKDLLE